MNADGGMRPGSAAKMSTFSGTAVPSGEWTGTQKMMDTQRLPLSDTCDETDSYLLIDARCVCESSYGSDGGVTLLETGKTASARPW